MKVVSNRVLSEMSDDYSDVARALGKMTQHLGADASDAITEASRAFALAASDLAEKIKAQSQFVTAKAREEVREHPIATIAIAVTAVGLVGYLIARTRAR